MIALNYSLFHTLRRLPMHGQVVFGRIKNEIACV